MVQLLGTKLPIGIPTSLALYYVQESEQTMELQDFQEEPRTDSIPEPADDRRPFCQIELQDEVRRPGHPSSRSITPLLNMVPNAHKFYEVRHRSY